MESSPEQPAAQSLAALAAPANQQHVGACLGFLASCSLSGSYRSLLIFDSSTDLSTIDKDALQRIQETSRDTLYRGRSRRSGAAMVNGSQDARLIMPLWNALCHSDPEIDLHFDIFTDLEPALAWLDIPPALGRSIARGGEAVAD